MENEISNDVLIEVNRLRLALKALMKPEVLSKFTDLLEEIDGGNSFAERYVYFSTHSENGADCRYARLAKQYFVDNNADNVATLIEWLYKNFARKVK